MTAKLETRVDDKTHERAIRLAKLNSPGNRVESVGEYNLTNRHWKFWISLNALPMPGEASGAASVGVPPRKENAATQPTGAPPEAQDKQNAKQNAAQVAVLLNSWGDPDHLEIGQLVVRGAELEITSAGNYYYARPSPLDLDVKVRHIPPRVAERDRPPLYGYLSGEASIKGTVLEPRDLKIDGKLLGEGVTLYQRSLGDFNVKVGGHIDGMHAMLRSEKLEMLKGQWSFDALYTQQSGAVTMNLRVADLDLREVGDLLVRFDPNWTGPVRQTKQDVDLLGGHVSAEWNIEVPRTDKDRLRVSGGVRATNVRAPGFSADLVDAKTLLERGTVTLGPIHVVRGITRTVDGQQSRVEGTADASVSADLDDLTQITVALNLVNWPLETGADGWADVSCGTEKLVIDLSSEPDAKQKNLPGKSATGTIEIASPLTYQGKTLGRARIIGDCLGRMIDLRKFDIQTLDGNVVGNGVIELEKPLEARAFFSWERVNSQRLVGLFPALKGLQGVYTGRLRVQPAVDPRAVGPLAISLELAPENGRYNAVQIGPTVILAYADYNRLVLNDPADLASTIRIAAGTLKLWGRISYHDLQTTKDAISSQLLVQFEGLDLNQVIHAAHPQAEETPGRLDGSLTILAATRGPRVHPRPAGVPPAPFSEKLATALVVHGPLKLSQAKLGALPVFSGIYDVMHAGQDVKASNGVGSVDVRMENGILELNNLRYFNRGTEVRGMFTIEQVWKLPDSPLHGTAIGSLRPLASISLPFFAEADRIIALLSSDLASIGVDGTVKNQHTYQIGLRDRGAGLRTLLLGEVPQERPENRAGPKTGATRMEQSP
jgi:hypothetical protein